MYTYICTYISVNKFYLNIATYICTYIHMYIRNLKKKSYVKVKNACANN